MPASWVFVNACFHLDEFYAELSDFFAARFPQARYLKGAIEYQKNMVVMPDYSSAKGKSFRIERNWPALFETAQGMLEYRQLDEPEAFRFPRIAEIAEETGWAPAIF
jgi:hypothetical protein